VVSAIAFLRVVVFCKRRRGRNHMKAWAEGG
jgi:hypothetical protein